MRRICVSGLSMPMKTRGSVLDITVNCWNGNTFISFDDSQESIEFLNQNIDKILQVVNLNAIDL